MSAPSWDQMWAGTVEAVAALACGETPIVLKPWPGELEPSRIYDDLWVDFAVADLVDAWNAGDGPECAA